MGFEFLQRRRLHDISSQTVPHDGEQNVTSALRNLNYLPSCQNKVLARRKERIITGFGQAPSKCLEMMRNLRQEASANVIDFCSSSMLCKTKHKVKETYGKGQVACCPDWKNRNGKIVVMRQWERLFQPWSSHWCLCKTPVGHSARHQRCKRCVLSWWQ